jgi:outer membrane immunogenic protein
MESEMKPRRFRGIAAAALTVAGPLAAHAADLSSWSARQFFAPPFTWTGSYVGLNAGGVWGSGSRSTTLYDAGFPLLSNDYPNTLGAGASGWLARGQTG